MDTEPGRSPLGTAGMGAPPWAGGLPDGAQWVEEAPFLGGRPSCKAGRSLLLPTPQLSGLGVPDRHGELKGAGGKVCVCEDPELPAPRLTPLFPSLPVHWSWPPPPCTPMSHSDPQLYPLPQDQPSPQFLPGHTLTLGHSQPATSTRLLCLPGDCGWAGPGPGGRGPGRNLQELAGPAQRPALWLPPWPRLPSSSSSSRCRGGGGGWLGWGAQGGVLCGHHCLGGQGAEGWVSMAVSAPLPLGWAGAGSPTGAE